MAKVQTYRGALVGLVPASLNLGVLNVDKGDPREIVSKYPPPCKVKTREGFSSLLRPRGKVRKQRLVCIRG